MKTKRKQIATLEHSILVLRDEIIKKEEENVKLKKENEELQHTLKQIEERVELIENAKSKEVEKYKKIIKELQESYKAEKQRYNTEHKNIIKTNEKLQEQTENVNSRLETIQKIILQNQTLNEKQQAERRSDQELRIRKLQAEISFFKSKCSDMELTNEKLKKEVYKLHQYQSLYEIEKKHHTQINTKHSPTEIVRTQPSTTKSNEIVRKELEERVLELTEELNREKKNAAELSELVCVLNQNRQNLEAELSWVKKQ